MEYGLKSKGSVVGYTRYSPPMTAVSEARKWIDEQASRSSPHKLLTLTVELTPPLAEAILLKNPKNRNTSERKATEYARDILSDRWALNGEPIIIADTGELNDGQHRCRAVQIAGKSIKTQMTFGVHRDTRTTVDVGVKRTSAQHLGMAGFQHYVQLSRAITTILTFKKTGKITTFSEGRPTSSEIMEWADTHPEMIDSVVAGLSIYRHLRASAGLFGGLHYLFAEKSREQADEFFSGLASGEMLGKGNPMFELRGTLIRDHKSKAKLPDAEIAARAIKAWNRFRANSRVGVLRRITRGRGKEDFPVPE